MKEKHLKYISYLKNDYVDSKDPFVIAIDRSPLEHIDAQIPLIFKCLFAIGHQVLFIKRANFNTTTDESIWSTRHKLNKFSGSEVGMFMFQDPSYEGISAAIYCPWSFINSSKNLDRLGEGFVIIHNPYAKNPLPDNFFKFGETWRQIGNKLYKINK